MASWALAAESTRYPSSVRKLVITNRRDSSSSTNRMVSVPAWCSCKRLDAWVSDVRGLPPASYLLWPVTVIKAVLPLFLVVVKTLSRFAAKPPGIHHLDKQRTGPVLRVTQSAVEHAHNVQADVEANKISQRQWTQGVRHAQFEYFVHSLRGSYALHHRVDGFIDQRHQHAVGNEAGSVFDLDRGLFQLFSKAPGGGVGII